MTETSAARRPAHTAVAAIVATAVCATLVVVLRAEQAGAQPPGTSTDSVVVEADPDSNTDGDSDDGFCDGPHGERGRLGYARRTQWAGQMAELIGIEEADLREALRSGRSLAEVAADHDVDVQTLVDAIVESIEERVDERLADGVIDSERADEMRANAETMAEQIVNRTHDDDERRGGRGGKGRHGAKRGSGAESDSAQAAAT